MLTEKPSEIAIAIHQRYFSAKDTQWNSDFKKALEKIDIDLARYNSLKKHSTPSLKSHFQRRPDETITVIITAMYDPWIKIAQSAMLNMPDEKIMENLRDIAEDFIINMRLMLGENTPQSIENLINTLEARILNNELSPRNMQLDHSGKEHIYALPPDW